MIYLTLLAVAALFSFLWLRARNRNSKGRFATASLATIFAFDFSVISLIIPSFREVVLTSILTRVGFSVPSFSPPSLLIELSVIALLSYINYVAFKCLKEIFQNWDGFNRRSDVRSQLGENESNVFVLAGNDLRSLVSFEKNAQVYPESTKRPSEDNSPLPEKSFKNIARDIYLDANSEAAIDTSAWRDNGRYWVGSISDVAHKSPKDLYIFPFEIEPTDDQVLERLNIVGEELVKLSSCVVVIFAGGMEVKPRYLYFKGAKIEVRSTLNMLTQSLELEGYARSLLSRFQDLKVSGSQVTLETAFVDIEAINRFEVDEPFSLLKKIRSWQSDNSSSHIAITGDYGQGKSTVTLKYCADWAQRFLRGEADGERIPLLIELRGQSPGDSTPLSFLGSWAAHVGLKASSLLLLIEGGGAIAIFEGFDELRNAGQEYYRNRHFAALWKFAFKRSKIIFTGRPNFFLDDREANQSLRGAKKHQLAGAPYSIVYQICPLDLYRIEEVCKAYNEDIAAEIVEVAREDSGFYDIVSRPSMLPVVISVWHKISQLRVREGQVSSAAIIDLYVDAIFERKEAELEFDRVERNAPEASRYILQSADMRRAMLSMVAWEMLRLSYQNTILRDEIQALIFKSYNDLLEASKHPKISRSLQENLRAIEEKFSGKDLSDKVTEVVSDLCTSGLLVIDPASGDGALKFAHKQFFEYLLADSFVKFLTSEAKQFWGVIVRKSDQSNLMSLMQDVPVACRFISQIDDTAVPGTLNFIDKLRMYSCLLFLSFANALPVPLKTLLAPKTVRRRVYPISSARELNLNLVVLIYCPLSFLTVVFAKYFGFDVPFEAEAEAFLRGLPFVLRVAFIAVSFHIFLMGIQMIIGASLNRKVRPVATVVFWGRNSLPTSETFQRLIFEILLNRRSVRLDNIQADAKFALFALRTSKLTFEETGRVVSYEDIYSKYRSLQSE